MSAPNKKKTRDRVRRAGPPDADRKSPRLSSVTLPLELLRLLDEEAARRGIGRSSAIQEAVRAWLGRAPDGGAAATRNAVPLPADEATFANVVLVAARASRTGRFGTNKVFISHVQEQLARDGIDVGDVDVFKARLVSAHRADRLTLSRADLVEAMSAKDVDDSETRYYSAEFHFIETP